MDNQARDSHKLYSSYMDNLQILAANAHVREQLKNCKANETMQSGYESMATINLDFCEFGLVDCLYAISICEDNLIGVDNDSEH